MAIDSPADPNLCLKEFRLSISGFGFDHFQCGLDVYRGIYVLVRNFILKNLTRENCTLVHTIVQGSFKTLVSHIDYKLQAKL